MSSLRSALKDITNIFGGLGRTYGSRRPLNRTSKSFDDVSNESYEGSPAFVDSDYSPDNSRLSTEDLFSPVQTPDRAFALVEDELINYSPMLLSPGDFPQAPSSLKELLRQELDDAFSSDNEQDAEVTMMKEFDTSEANVLLLHDYDVSESQSMLTNDFDSFELYQQFLSTLMVLELTNLKACDVDALHLSPLDSTISSLHLDPADPFDNFLLNDIDSTVTDDNLIQQQEEIKDIEQNRKRIYSKYNPNEELQIKFKRVELAVGIYSSRIGPFSLLPPFSRKKGSVLLENKIKE
ncbi:hypothetical protein RCL1_008927 [Eukaryota sp. TZLM3-RCL]